MYQQFSLSNGRLCDRSDQSGEQTLLTDVTQNSTDLGASFASTARQNLPGDVEIKFLSHTANCYDQQFLQCLTENDFNEFSNIRHSGTRQKKLHTRALLRHQLSRVADESFGPEQWVFRRTPQGKPYLGSNCPNIFFSCSHTATVSVVSTCKEGPIGVDVEDNRAHFDLPFIAGFTSLRERVAVSDLPSKNRQDALVRLWALKEAYVKCVGTGIAEDLTQIEFDLTPLDGQATLLRSQMPRPADIFCRRVSSTSGFLTAAVVTGLH